MVLLLPKKSQLFNSQFIFSFLENDNIVMKW